MEEISHDILIIGGGAAGLRAALAAALVNPKLSIGLVSKVYPVRSHTVSAEGGIAGVLRDYDDFEKHAYDTIKGSDFLADQDVVEFFVREAPKEIIQLEHWGCPWSREENGKIAVRAFGGMSVKRTVFAADKTGFYMLHSLFERTLKYDQIVCYDEWYVSALFSNGERICGVYAFDMRAGKWHVLQGKSVILATGGAGKMFQFTTNAGIKTGDGMALALRAGVPLKDMEFVQFHPTGLPRTGILITEGARGEGGYLLNKNGERFLKNYLPEKMELGPRDIISRAIVSEIKAGRGFEGRYGPYVHLDIRHLGEEKINERLPLVREVSIDFAGVDPVKEPIPVRPVAHYFMGGVHTNRDTETPLSGLFAAGETACVTINGANRLGSNSLAECLVFGRVAGEKAALYADSSDFIDVPEGMVRDEMKRIDAILNNNGNEMIATLREEMQNCMEIHMGINRDKSGIEAGIKKIQELISRFARIKIQDKSAIFNTELLSALELGCMLEVAHVMLVSALAREESRGSHLREDFPKRDDEKFLKHLLVSRNGVGVKIDELPVTITKWQPEERKY